MKKGFVTFEDESVKQSPLKTTKNFLNNKEIANESFKNSKDLSKKFPILKQMKQLEHVKKFNQFQNDDYSIKPNSNYAKDSEKFNLKGMENIESQLDKERKNLPKETTTINFRVGQDKNYVKAQLILYENYLHVAIIPPNKFEQFQTNFKLLQNVSYEQSIRNSLYQTYNFEYMDKHLCCLNFDTIASKLNVNDKKKECILDVFGSTTLFVFQFFDLTNYKKFSNLIEKQIINCKGNLERLIEVALSDKYYKKFYLSFKSMMSCAKTGDIIIFKNDFTLYKFFKTCGKKLFDHVGMVVKFGKNPGLLEVGEKECQIRKLEDILEIENYPEFETIIYRELVNPMPEIEREEYNNIFVKKMEEFCSKIIGIDGRKISLCEYVFGGKNKSFKFYEDGKNWENIPCFFNSQLIVAALSYCNLFHLTKSSECYFPNFFEGNSKIKLLDNCFYGPEMVINFD